MSSQNRVYLVNEKLLPLNYAPGMGAWTYHVEVPHSKELRGRWGKLKVSGTLDDLPINSKNLFSRTGKNKILSINQETRKAIQKNPGELIRVTLYLEQQAMYWDETNVKELASSLGIFSSKTGLIEKPSIEFLKNLNSQDTEEKQFQILLDWFKELENGY